MADRAFKFESNQFARSKFAYGCFSRVQFARRWITPAWFVRPAIAAGRCALVAAAFAVVAAAGHATAHAQQLPDPEALKGQAITTPGGSVRPPAGAVNMPYHDPSSVRRPDSPGDATSAQRPPSSALGDKSVTDSFWDRIRHGQSGNVVLPGAEQGVLIQSAGEDWRLIRNDQIVRYGGQLLLGVMAAIVLFFLLRGRIRIDGGRSGKVIPRFTLAQRITHWFAATLFVLLAVSGLIILFGKSMLIPVLGPAAFSVVASAAMQGHNLFGPLFLPAVLAILILFIKGNAPRIVDFMWLLKGGGLFGGHASSYKYNAGQKLWFALTVVAGLAISVSGFILLFPDFFGARQDAQLANLAHAIAAVLFIATGIGHAYIGSIGMEGAFEAMSRGTVDENWAKEHHDLWYAEHKGEATTDAARAEVSAAAAGDGIMQGVRP